MQYITLNFPKIGQTYLDSDHYMNFNCKFIPKIGQTDQSFGQFPMFYGQIYTLE